MQQSPDPPQGRPGLAESSRQPGALPGGRIEPQEAEATHEQPNNGRGRSVLRAPYRRRPLLCHRAAGGGMTLFDEHLDKIRSSGLTAEQAAALGWSSQPDGSLQIPYLKPDGTAERCHDGRPFHRHRLTPDLIAERVRNGLKPAKYISPPKDGCRLYHSALAIQRGDYSKRLADRFTALRITEGELKTESATVHDPARITVGIGGVSSWQDHYDGGEESRPLVDFDEIPLEGREVRLCFDSDFRKPQVAAALRALAEFLASKGAHVLIEVLPNGLDGERLGLDDLVHRHGPEVLQRITAIARTPFKIRRRKDGDERVWAFNPEPQDTRERNAYLSGLLGNHWRRSADGKDHWQRWTGSHWREVIGDDDLTAAIEQFAELQEWRNRELSTMRSLQAAFRRTVAPAASHNRPGLLPFSNGCLVVEEGQFIPHDPAHGNSWALPFAYDATARCPGIEALLQDRLDDAASVALFRAFARALLTGDRCKAFLEITGPGETGKSVLANLLIALVGHSNHAAGTLQRLEDRAQRFETLKLRGKRLAIFSECQDYSGQLQTLKALTGGDSIAAEVKGGRHLDFSFAGGVVLVGNGPIRASDPTGAVINRRRSLYVGKVISTSSQRTLLEPDGMGGWRGDLVPELPGLVNWALAMPAAEARLALARDVQSLARAEAELRALLDTDLLSEWADETLIWDSDCQAARVGRAGDSPESFLFPSYLRFIEQQGRNGRPLSLRTFKSKLVDLLRDTLGLPLPAGNTSSGDYRERGRGSVVPGLRWRNDGDEMQGANGVIRHAFLARLSPQPAGTDQTPPGTEAERIGNGETPVGNGWNGWNGSDQTGLIEENADQPPSGAIPYRAMESAKSVTAVPSVPQKGFDVSPSVPPTPPIRSARPPADGQPVAVDGESGWWLPGTMPTGSGPTLRVLVVDPKGHSRNVERRRITLSGASPAA